MRPYIYAISAVKLTMDPIGDVTNNQHRLGGAIEPFAAVGVLLELTQDRAEEEAKRIMHRTFPASQGYSLWAWSVTLYDAASLLRIPE